MSSHVAPPSTLLVILAEHPSDLVAKGEFTSRYYNPGDLFDEVHILLTNDDRVEATAMQKTVGRAKLHLHRLPADRRLFARSLGWRPWLLNSWVESAIALARSIRPVLIRCHAAHLNVYVAARIKRALGTPFVISLHTNPDDEMNRRAATWKQRLADVALESSVGIAFEEAELVMPVYEGILPFARRLGARRLEVVYNALNPDFLREKTSYELHDPVRLLSVGRQIPGKDPANIIRALVSLPEVHLTLVGDGSLHKRLRETAAECGVAAHVTFVPAKANDELCAELPTYDIFAAHCDYGGIPKAVMEPLLSGLPVVINRRQGTPVAELEGDFVVRVDNTPSGYAAAISRLIENDNGRERLGRLAYKNAQQRWAPGEVEARVVEIYRRVILAAGTAA